MWPDLMGPGWERHLVAAAGLLAAMIASFVLLARLAFREEPEPLDPFLVLWHRYEEGDLTRQEFERRKRSLAHRDRVRIARVRWARTPAVRSPLAAPAPARGTVFPDRTPTEP